MNVTTINKFINLFFVGTAALTVVGVAFWPYLPTDLDGAPFDSISLALPLVFLSLAVLVGAVFDGLRYLTIGRLIRAIADPGGMSCDPSQVKVQARFPLGLGIMNKEFKQYTRWRCLFIKAIKLNARGIDYVSVDDIVDPDLSRAFATSICYSYAPPTTFARATSHYATHLLAANLVLVILFAVAVAFCSMWVHGAWQIWLVLLVVGLGGVMMAMLMAVSIEFYWYSYELVFRYGYLWAVTPDSPHAADAPNAAGLPAVIDAVGNNAE